MREVELREALKRAGLRCTRVRLDVLDVLTDGGAPVSHRDVAERVPSADQATVFRNLVALVEAGLVRRVDVGDRVWRYERAVAEAHGHAHFTCVSCGDVTCLDDVRVIGPGGRLPVALEEAEVQLRGVCASCR